jgi:YD repeat-containing protein
VHRFVGAGAWREEHNAGCPPVQHENAVAENIALRGAVRLPGWYKHRSEYDAAGRLSAPDPNLRKAEAVRRASMKACGL